jgi:pimeloyl-ACP methyl ester carboxylesterase
MQIVVDDLLINYEIKGSGQSVLILHGWNDSLSTLQQYLGEIAADHQIILVDLPGFGKSQNPHSNWDLSSYAQFLRSFLKKINQSPSVLIGHSFGGSVLIKAIATKVVDADKLVLIASSGIRLRSSQNKSQLTKLTQKSSKLALNVLPTSIKRKVRQKIYTRIGSDLLLRPDLEPIFKNIISEDLSEEASHISIPTLLIYGEQDTETPPHYGRIFHEKISPSTLEIIANSGHYVFIDQQQTVLKLIKDFIDA